MLVKKENQPQSPHEMKLLSKPLNLYFIIILSTLLFSCSSDDDGIYFDKSQELAETVDNVEYSNLETEILQLVNEHRESIGLSRLSPLNIVSGVADTHTEYMIEAGEISHDHFTERAELLQKNADAKKVGENVAFGFHSAQGVLNGWLNSPGHKAVIENPKYTHCGISTEACAASCRNYFTQIFIEK